MEILQNGVMLLTPTGTFPLSTDSILLADFVKLQKNAKVLDLGAGCATLGMLLCAKDESCHITGIEIDPIAHQAAIDNISRNGLSDRVSSICEDLRILPDLLKPGSFSCCISNPPYFSGGPASKEVPQARRNDTCSTAQLFQSAAWALKYGGTFYLVHKPEKLAELCACAVNAGLEPKNLRLIRYDPTKNISLVLIACKKGAKPGLKWEELCLKNADGTPTEYYRKLYHI